MNAYWIESSYPHATLGFGITARSRDDAIAIVRAFGYERYLPNPFSGVRVAEGVTVASLDEPHVVATMGPIAIRGMWYPFVVVGIPRWAEERITSMLADGRHANHAEPPAATDGGCGRLSGGQCCSGPRRC